MTPDEVRAIFLPIHGTLGVLALVVGGVAMAVPKRPGLHPRLGRTWFVLMCLVVVAATPVILVTGNLFLGGMGVFAWYLAFVGFRIAQLRPPLRKPSAIDIAATYGLQGVMAAFFVLGLWSLGNNGNMMAVVILVFGIAGLHRGWLYRKFWREPHSKPRDWIPMHLRAMTGAYIAAMTAFTAAVGTKLWPFIPEFLLWVGPAVLLVPISRLMERKVRAEHAIGL